MDRWLKILALAASHLVVCAAVAEETRGYLARRAIQRAQADPMTRLGMRSEVSPAAVDSFPSLGDDLQAAGAKLDPVTRQVLGLGVELRVNDMTGATRTCNALGFTHCEPSALDSMRKGLLR